MLPPGFTIRLAHAPELAALPELERQSQRRFAGREQALGVRSDLELISSHALQAANEDGRVWLAVDEQGQPVGFALLTELGLFAHLLALAVLPAFGRQGLGSALLEAVCEWAGSRGFSAVTLSTFRDVAWNAPFFEQRGFAEVTPEEQPPELLEIVELERRRGLRTELRVLLQREV
jgi:GNAT superfamily N-acetyltransferase